MSVREYKENQDFKKKIEQERQRLLSKNERLQEIQKQLDKADEKAEQSHKHNLRFEEYCREQGITYLRYERQCFYADRGYGEYPEPERSNPDRQIEREIAVSYTHLDVYKRQLLHSLNCLIHASCHRAGGDRRTADRRNFPFRAAALHHFQVAAFTSKLADEGRFGCFRAQARRFGEFNDFDPLHYAVRPNTDHQLNVSTCLLYTS